MQHIYVYKIDVTNFRVLINQFFEYVYVYVYVLRQSYQGMKEKT